MEKEWARWLFYVDVITIAIFVIATIYLAKDAFWAGYYRGLPDINKYGEFLWHMARDVAFQTATLIYILFRMFRCQFLLTKKP